MTHDHNTPDPRPETLREELAAKLYSEQTGLGVEFYEIASPGEQESYRREAAYVAEYVLAEIEQRAGDGAELVIRNGDGPYGWTQCSLADFIAEIRGEIQ